MPRVSSHALSYYSPTHPSLLVDASGMHIDEGGFLQSRQRAGGPYLCSLPADQGPLRMSFRYRHTPEDDSNVKQKTTRILDNAGIDYTEIAITGRRSRVDSEPVAVTIVLIVAKEGSHTEIWRDILKQIHHDVGGDLHDDVSVELIDEVLNQCFGAFCALKTDSISLVWNTVRDTIYAELNCDIRSVAYYRYGPITKGEENPPMVIVAVKKKATRSFDDDNKKVQGILERLGVRDTSVLSHRDSMWGAGADWD